MQPSVVSPARLHVALVAACLLLADYLPTWHKPWFVAEGGHFGGRSTLTFLLLLGLFARWRPAVRLIYVLLAVQLLVAGYILSYNIPTGGPTLGFALISSLHIIAGCILHFSSAIKQHFSHLPAAAHL